MALYRAEYERSGQALGMTFWAADAGQAAERCRDLIGPLVRSLDSKASLRLHPVASRLTRDHRRRTKQLSLIP